MLPAFKIAVLYKYPILRAEVDFVGNNPVIPDYTWTGYPVGISRRCFPDGFIYTEDAYGGSFRRAEEIAIRYNSPCVISFCFNASSVVVAEFTPYNNKIQNVVYPDANLAGVCSLLELYALYPDIVCINLKTVPVVGILKYRLRSSHPLW